VNETLEKAIARLKDLPEDQQEAMGAIILEELEDEEGWDERFARTQDVLGKLGEEAQAEYRAGKTQEM
jgi:hypothetical protein